MIKLPIDLHCDSKQACFLKCPTVLMELLCVSQHVQLRGMKTSFLLFWVLLMSSTPFSMKTYGCSQVIKRHLLFWTDTWASDWSVQTELEECYQGIMEAGEIISVFPGIHQVPNCSHYSVWVWRSWIQLFNSAWRAHPRWRRDVCVCVWVFIHRCMCTPPLHRT